MGQAAVKKILVIEDSELTRCEIRDALKGNSSYAIAEADNGSKGFELLSENSSQFDLIVLDYHMPGMNGLDMLRKLVKSGNKVKCPVVMITTEVEERGTEVKDLNVVSWVLKPIRKEKFEYLISQLFSYMETRGEE